jgi:hypothetical protein
MKALEVEMRQVVQRYFPKETGQLLLDSPSAHSLEQSTRVVRCDQVLIPVESTSLILCLFQSQHSTERCSEQPNSKDEFL